VAANDPPVNVFCSARFYHDLPRATNGPPRGKMGGKEEVMEDGERKGVKRRKV